MSVILAIAVPLVGFAYHKNKKLRTTYELVWLKSTKLLSHPEYIMGIRGLSKYGFDKHYHERDYDNVVRTRIENCEPVLILGKPLAGKSRAIFQALKSLKEPCAILAPRIRDTYSDVPIPFCLAFWRKKVLLLDDLDKYAGRGDLLNFFLECKKKGFTVVASCRTGLEYDFLLQKMEGSLQIFGQAVEIPKLTKEEADVIAGKTGKVVPSRFDGQVGSIFIDIDTMKKRYQSCSNIERAILGAIKRLYCASLYQEKCIFNINSIKLVCKQIDELDLPNFELNSLLSDLEKRGFLELREGRVQSEEAYIEFVIEQSYSELANLKLMTEVFRQNRWALITIGGRAHSLGFRKTDYPEYLAAAIAAFWEATKQRVSSDSEDEYAWALANESLGDAYFSLAEVGPSENRIENCREAVRAFERALITWESRHDNLFSARVRASIAGVYTVLASSKETRPKRALTILAEASKLCDESLKVHTLRKSPRIYARNLLTLGIVWSRLADLHRDTPTARQDLLETSMKSYEEALKVFQKENDLDFYAATLGNAAITYRELGNTTHSPDFLKKGMEACREALKINTMERNPLRYAWLHEILALLHCALAFKEEMGSNFAKAIDSFKEALKVKTKKKIPLDYSNIQNQVGNTYIDIAEFASTDPVADYDKAIDAYKESLDVIAKEKIRKSRRLSRNIRSGLVRAYLGRAAARKKGSDFTEAMKDIVRALKLDRSSSKVFNAMADTHLLLGQYNQALKSSSKTLELEPDNADAYYFRAWAHYKLGIGVDREEHLQKALHDCDSAIRIRPNETAFYITRSSIHLEMQNHEGARQDACKAIELEPDNVEGLLRRGNACFAQGSPKKAIEDYSTALTHKPDCAQAYINRALAYERLGDHDRSLADLSKAIEVNSGDYVAYEYRSRIYTDLRRFDKAIADLNVVLELKLGQESAYQARAYAFYMLGLERDSKTSFENAVRDYSKAILLRDDNQQSYVRRGMAYERLGAFEEALRDFNKSLRMKPDDHEAYRGRGITNTSRKDFRQAIDDFDAALSLKPDYAAVYAGRAAAYLAWSFQSNSKGNCEKALVDIEAAFKLKLNEFDIEKVLFLKALALKGLERWDEALQCLTELADIPGNTQITAIQYSIRADILAHLERYRESTLWYEKALEIVPDEIDFLFGLATDWLFLDEPMKSLDLATKLYVHSKDADGKILASFVRILAFVQLGEEDRLQERISELVSQAEFGRKSSGLTDGDFSLQMRLVTERFTHEKGDMLMQLIEAMKENSSLSGSDRKARVEKRL